MYSYRASYSPIAYRVLASSALLIQIIGEGERDIFAKNFLLLGK
jgi:hypothetical protein